MYGPFAVIVFAGLVLLNVGLLKFCDLCFCLFLLLQQCVRRDQLDAGLDSAFAFYRRNTRPAGQPRPGHRHGKLEWRRATFQTDIWANRLAGLPAAIWAASDIAGF